MPLAEQMGFRHRMQTRCTMSPTTPGLPTTRQCQRPGRRLVSIPTPAGYTLSAAALHSALPRLPTRCSSPNPWRELEVTHGVLFADGAQYKRNDKVGDWAPELNGEAWMLCPSEKPQAKACATCRPELHRYTP